MDGWFMARQRGMNGWMIGWVDRGGDERMDDRMGGQRGMDGWMIGWVDREGMNGWMDDWIGGQRGDEWMDGLWLDRGG